MTVAEAGRRDTEDSYSSSCSGGGSEVARGKGINGGAWAGGDGVPVVRCSVKSSREVKEGAHLMDQVFYPNLMSRRGKSLLPS